MFCLRTAARFDGSALLTIKPELAEWIDSSALLTINPELAEWIDLQGIKYYNSVLV